MKLAFVFCPVQRPVFPSNWLWNLLVTASVIGCLSLGTLAPVSAFAIRTMAGSKISIFKNHTGENTNAKKSGRELGDTESEIICSDCSSAADNNIRFH